MTSELRHRDNNKTTIEDDSSETMSASSTDDYSDNLKKDMRYSYGKTPDNKVFRVPLTKEMVAHLLSPNTKKDVFDWITLGTMAVEIGLFFVLPLWLKRLAFIFIFFFWRFAYNVGLGYLLKLQSDSRGLVRLAKRYSVFDVNKNPRAYHWFKKQLSVKMGDDYDFDSAPIEYNTWLLYRQLVDLILMNDFTTYVLFAMSWFNTTPGHSIILGTTLRWVGGLFLIAFNIWVKIDAQRVVKDFAWYWGDFFFLIEQSLTFDGVFEMAPHPMYSIGYIGYYGISLMCASYTVLFVSIAAHALQFAFLAYVETPHIEKTYNPQPALTRHKFETLDTTASRDFYTNYFRRDLIAFKNFDMFRSTDYAAGMVILYSIVTPMFSSRGVTIAVVQAFIWRLIHSLGTGGLLAAQSNNKYITRHFIKWGGGVQEAFQNWKSIYNLSLCMTYVTFFVACWKTYTLPDNWTYGMTLLRHTLGLMFISLHIWTSVSIYEVLGDFGWFYGDFFMDEHPSELLYTGIYRFLNNPEKIMGHAAFWGMALIANSPTIFILALFSQTCNFLFLNYVESPHMHKLYGDEIRKEAGLTKTLKSAAIAIPKSTPAKLIQQEITKLISEKQELRDTMNSTKDAVKETIEKVEKAVEETKEAVGDMVEAARPRLQEVLEETKELLESSRSRVIPSVANIEMYDLSLYKIEVEQSKFQIGQPIRLTWKAPEYHGARDWIGIYQVKANKSTHVTSVSSRLLWYWTNKVVDENTNDALFPPETPTLTSGALEFKGATLPWKVGKYEFRYHHDGKHNVMARSIPFEIEAPVTPRVIDVSTTKETLLKLVQHILGNNPEIMPASADEGYVGMGESESKHLVYCIKLLYNVEFAWEVVNTDKCVTRLSKRILHAREALSPFKAEARRLSSTSLNLNTCPTPLVAKSEA